MKRYSLARMPLSWFMAFSLFIHGAAYAVKQSELVAFHDYWLKKSEVKANKVVCSTCNRFPEKLQHLLVCAQGAKYYCHEYLRRENAEEGYDNSDLFCPGCGVEHKFSVFGDESYENASPELAAYCNNELCEWHMSLGDSSIREKWNTHKETCPFSPIKRCRNCGRLYGTAEEDEHFSRICSKRIIMCDICGDSHTADEDTNHERKCTINLLRKAAEGVVEFKNDEEHRRLLLKTVKSLERFDKDVDAIKRSLEGALDSQFDRFAQMLTDADVSHAQVVDISAPDMESELKFHKVFIGQSDDITFYGSGPNADHQLLVVIQPTKPEQKLDQGHAVEKGLFSELYTATVWLLDKSGREDGWAGKISDDIVVTFILPIQNSTRAFRKIKSKPNIFDHPTPVKRVLPTLQVASNYPAYQLGRLDHEPIEFDHIKRWLHPGPGAPRFKVALSPREPVIPRVVMASPLSLSPDIPRAVQQQLPLVLPAITQTLIPFIKTGEKSLRLILPKRLFQQSELSRDDAKIYGEQGGFYFTVGEESWHILVAPLNGSHSLAFQLVSDEYKSHLKVVRPAFGALKSDFSRVWPSRINLAYVSQTQSDFLAKVKGGGYGTLWPRELFADAEGDDHVVVNLDLEIDDGAGRKGGLSIIDNGRESFKEGDQTLYERIRMLEIASTHKERITFGETVDQLKAENKTLRAEVIPGLEHQISELKLGAMYSKNEEIGTLVKQGEGSYEWKVHQLKGYSHDYHFSSPLFEFGGVQYQMEFIPRPRDIDKLNIYVRAVSSQGIGGVPWFKPSWQGKFEFYNVKNKVWMYANIDFDEFSRSFPSRNPAWKRMRSDSGFYISSIDRDYFSSKSGLKVKINLQPKMNEIQLRRESISENTALLNNEE